MTTLSSASIFINKINQNFPISGRDNDTQGFRDNFKNIKQALSSTDQDVDYLKINAVKLTETNNFGNNIIQNASFKDCADIVFDETETIQTGDVELDYRNGSFQKYKVSSGTHAFSVINLPGTNRSGSMMLTISTASMFATTVTFSAVNLYNYGASLPVTLTGPNPALFQLWSDGDSDNLYLKQI